MNLLASYGWAIDVGFFVIIMIGVLAGVAVGFARCLSKIIGTVVSVIFAASYCVPFGYALESLFGLQSALYGALNSARLTVILSSVIAFVALVVVIRLLVWLIGCAASALAKRGGFLGAINRLFGGMVGAGIALSLIFFVLVILTWVNIDSVVTLINESRVVRSLYRSEALQYLAELSFL